MHHVENLESEACCCNRQKTAHRDMNSLSFTQLQMHKSYPTLGLYNSFIYFVANCFSPLAIHHRFHDRSNSRSSKCSYFTFPTTFPTCALFNTTGMIENCGRSVWAEFLTDDPAAWKVRVGEHYMFREDATQLDIDIERILFHPDRNRERQYTCCLRVFTCTNLGDGFDLTAMSAFTSTTVAKKTRTLAIANRTRSTLYKRQERNTFSEHAYCLPVVGSRDFYSS